MVFPFTGQREGEHQFMERGSDLGGQSWRQDWTISHMKVNISG